MSGKPIRNTAEPSQVKESGDREKRVRERELNDVRAVMGMPEGRRFMWRLINDVCHYDLDDAHSNGSITYKSLGERNVGRLIKGDVYEAALDAYHLMEREHVTAKLKGDIE